MNLSKKNTAGGCPFFKNPVGGGCPFFAEYSLEELQPKQQRSCVGIIVVVWKEESAVVANTKTKETSEDFSIIPTLFSKLQNVFMKAQILNMAFRILLMIFYSQNLLTKNNNKMMFRMRNNLFLSQQNQIH